MNEMILVLMGVQPPFWPDPASSCVVALNLTDKVPVICLHLPVSNPQYSGTAWPGSLPLYTSIVSKDSILYFQNKKGENFPQNP